MQLHLGTQADLKLDCIGHVIEGYDLIIGQPQSHHPPYASSCKMNILVTHGHVVVQLVPQLILSTRKIFFFRERAGARISLGGKHKNNINRSDLQHAFGTQDLRIFPSTRSHRIRSGKPDILVLQTPTRNIH